MGIASLRRYRPEGVDLTEVDEKDLKGKKTYEEVVADLAKEKKINLKVDTAEVVNAKALKTNKVDIKGK